MGAAMKWTETLLVALLVLVVGCDKRIGAPPEVSRPLDEHWEAIEFRVCLRSEPYKPGDIIGSGEFTDVFRMTIPVRIKDGPGEAHAIKDWVWFHAKWDGVRVVEGDPRKLVFDNFSYLVENRYKTPYGSSWWDNGWNQPGTTGLNTQEWRDLQSTVGIDPSAGDPNHDPRIWCKQLRLAPVLSRPDILLGEKRR
jgi:hypothetical protein